MDELEKGGSLKSGLPRLLELAFTKKPLIILSAIFSALASVASFIPFIAIFFIIKETLAVYPDFSILHASQIIDYGWFAFIGVVANILLYFIALMFSHLAAFGTLYKLKVEFASHIASLPLGFHLNYGSGKLRKVMDENIEKIEGFIAHQFPDLVASLVAPFVMIGILMVVDWRFGLVSLLGIVLAFYVEFRAYGNDGAKAMMGKYQKSLEEMNNATVEYIRGISVVKAFRQTVYSFRNLNDTIRRYTDFVLPYTLSWENYMSGFLSIINHIYLLLLPLGIYLGYRSNDYTAFALSFIFYLIFVPSISNVMTKIMYVSSASMQISSGVERMDEVLSLHSLAKTEKPQKTTGSSITFEKVHFSYEPQSKTPALKEVSFTAHQGEVTAIVGPSGSGKSTIAHLIPRFYDIQKGSIQIGDVDIRDMELSYLMEKVSFVFQDVFLFKQSIMENIRIGNKNATDAQVVAAAKAAQCHEFVENLPKGYQTVIGTRGVHLSGGEKQRIAIARAIVKDAPIIVLDEATAFADPENEHLIQKAFEKLMKGKTVILIAHRLSTIKSAQKILVMDQGSLIEEGNHETLIAKGGKYAKMWQMYTSTLQWKLSTGKGENQ